MIKKIIYTLVVVFTLVGITTAQTPVRSCATMEVLDRLQQEDPNIIQNMQQIENFTQQYIANPTAERTIINIPVVVHVVYNTSAQNISTAQIDSQIAILNRDYHKLNADWSLTPNVFLGSVADCEVQFCLAARDPNGAATTGIERRQSTVASWSTNDAVKHYANGGLDAWDATQYLNLWVCKLGGGVLGYAQFPGGAAATDGVVITYTGFGNIGTATAPYNLGRTATHEVGHWLNLRHIWGDATCGNDLVSDTPPAQTSNFGCPTFPHNLGVCSGNTTGEMTMNFMDYTDDACMYMFTAGQKARMQALFVTGGARVGLVTSLGCTPPSTACGTPTGLGVSSVTSVSAVLGWTAVSGATSYNVQWKSSSTPTWSANISTNTNSYTLSGLSASASYDFRVQAVCTNLGTFSSSYTFSTSSACSDVFEPNNTNATAANISANTSYVAIKSSTTDIDWYKFNTTANQPKVKVTLTNLPANYSLRLYSSAGTLLGTSANAGTANETVIYNTATAGATYYVKVYGNATSTSCYTFQAQIGSTNFKVEDGQVDASMPNALNLYPNPVSNQLTVEYQNDIAGQSTITMNVFDVMGKLVMTQTTESFEGDNAYYLDMTNLLNGMYIMEVTDGTNRQMRKFMVQH